MALSKKAARGEAETGVPVKHQVEGDESCAHRLRERRQPEHGVVLGGSGRVGERDSGYSGQLVVGRHHEVEEQVHCLSVLGQHR